jgi:hypothetical protein
MPDLFTSLMHHLDSQSQGDTTAARKIRALADQICAEHVYRDPSISPQQIRGIELLLGEWRGMFSYSPGRAEGIAPLIALLDLIRHRPYFDPLELHGQREWKRIIDLRGPVETVLIYSCGSCSIQYPRMGMSGFLNLIDFLCGKCGNVIFKSTYDKLSEVACPCGGVARVGCPTCGSAAGRVIEEVSPYLYFSGHKFYRDDQEAPTT